MTADEAIVSILVLGVLLFVVCASMAWTAKTHESERRNYSRSNARVLREYQSICLYRPHHIVTIEPTERPPHANHSSHR